MKNSKNFTLLFTIKSFEKSYLYKDVGLIMNYLCKEYNLKGRIIFSNEIKKEIPTKFRNIDLEEIEYIKIPKIIKKIDKFKILENINFYKYLYKNSKKIDYLMFFHYGVDKIFLIWLYKLLNSRGKVYIKMDSDGSFKSKAYKVYVIKYLLKIFEDKVDLISIETLDALEKIKRLNLFKMNKFNKLIYIPNGFDDEYLIKNNIKIKKFNEKENIMITVGRLGTIQKNNELLLRAIKNIDLRNWKILFIGPYTEEFKKEYNNFIKENQNKKDKVLLIGNITERKELYNYYNNAKVFILTSRWEGSAIVYPEALKFGDYIITTDVGGARDITNNGSIGTVINVENENQLQNEIKKVIENKIKLEKKYKDSLELSNKKFLWSNIVKNKKLEKFFRSNHK